MPDAADALLLFTMLALTLHLVTAAIAAVRCRRPAQAPPQMPPITILRPVCGMDQHDALTLGSTFELDYPNFDIIFCAAQASDPGAHLVRRLVERYPQVRAQLLIGDDRASPNPKLNNLIKGWQAPTAEWVVMADSNVLMPRDYLQQLLAAWTPDAGLVCSPPVGTAPDSFMAEVEAAFLNTYQARWQLSADSAGFGFAQGKSMLWHRPLLDGAGGIAALALELAEDAAATKIVRRAGRNVRLTRAPFAQPLGLRSARQVWDRQLRWGRLRRMTFPAAFTPEILSGMWPPLAALFLWSHLTDSAAALPAFAFLVLWYGAEALLSWSARWHLNIRSPVAWIMRDTLLPALWIGAIAGSGMTWRGTDLTPVRSN